MASRGGGGGGTVDSTVDDGEEDDLALITSTLRAALFALPLADVKAAFESDAVGGEGGGLKLREGQVRAALRRLGVRVTPHEVTQLLDVFDTMGDGCLRVDDFMEWLASGATGVHDGGGGGGEEEAGGDVATTRLLNRVRGVLMGAGEDSLRAMFTHPTTGALRELTIPALADRLDELGLADVDDEAMTRLIHRMDASNDGVVTYGELSAFLQQRTFAGKLTRMLRRAAALLRRKGACLQELMELTALRAGTADMNVAHDDRPAMLSPTLMRHLFCDVLAIPLSQPELTALMALADLDGDGNVDVEEVVVCAGEEYDVALGEELRDDFAHEVLDGESAIAGFPRAMTNPDTPTPSTPAPPVVVTMGMVLSDARTEGSASVGGSVGGDGSAPPPPVGGPRVGVGQGPTPPTLTIIPPAEGGDEFWGLAAGSMSAPMLRVMGPPVHAGTGVSLYTHPPPGSFVGVPPFAAVWARHDSVVSGSARLPATAWPWVCESVFVTLCGAGRLPLPPGTPHTAGPTAISGPVREVCPPPHPSSAGGASVFAGRPSSAATMDIRRLPQALASCGLALPSPTLEFLQRKHDNGSGCMDVGTFMRVVDEVVRSQWWEGGRAGLWPVNEARVRQALTHAPGLWVNNAVTTATTDAWPVHTAQLMHRHTMATALALHCSAGGLTLEEAVCLAAWTPGQHQPLATAAVMKTVVSLIRHGRLPPSSGVEWGVVLPLPVTSGGDGGADHHPTITVEPLSAGGPSPLPTAVTDTTFVMHATTGSAATVPFINPSGGGRGGGEGRRRGSIGSTTGSASVGGRGAPAVPPASTVVMKALCAASLTPDISVDAVITWLRSLAALGACMEQVTTLAPPPATTSRHGGAVGHATTVEHVVAGPHAYLYAVLPPLARSAIRKLCSLALALPTPVACVSQVRAASPLPPTSVVSRDDGGRGAGTRVGGGTGLPPPRPSTLTMPAGPTALSAGLSAFELGSDGASGFGPGLIGATVSTLLLTHAPRWPLTFQPSRLAPLALAHAGTSVAAMLLDGGWEADPGGQVMGGSMPSWAPSSLPTAAATSPAGGGSPVLGSTPADAVHGGAEGAMSPSLAYAASAGAAPAGSNGAATPPGSAALVTSGLPVARARDGVGVMLRWASLVPGAPPKRSGWLSGFTSATTGSGSDGWQDHLPRVRAIGGGVAPADGVWAGDGTLVRPNQLTLVLDIVAAAGIPCPPDDGLRSAIYSRVVRVAVVDMVVDGGASTPPRMRLLSNVAVIPATWNMATEEVWSFAPTSAAPASHLVIRTDGPRDRGGPGAALLLLEANVVVARSQPAPPTAPPSPTPTPGTPGVVSGDGYVYEEMVCAWTMVPLTTLASQPTTHRLKMMGGSPGAPMTISPGDILQNRVGWRAMAKALGGPITVPEITLTSRPLSRIPVAERQAMGTLPLTCIVPMPQVHLLAAWRSAIATHLLHRHRSHKPPSHTPIHAPPLAVLAAAARLVAAGGDASASALSVLANAFEAELTAAQRRRPPSTPQAVLHDLLARCMVAVHVQNVGFGASPGEGAVKHMPPPMDSIMGSVITRWLAAPPATALTSADLVFHPTTMWDALV